MTTAAAQFSERERRHHNRRHAAEVTSQVMRTHKHKRSLLWLVLTMMALLGVAVVVREPVVIALLAVAATVVGVWWTVDAVHEARTSSSHAR